MSLKRPVHRKSEPFRLRQPLIRLGWRKRQPGWQNRLVNGFDLAILSFLGLLAAALALAYLHFEQDLPPIDALQNAYRPPTVSTILASDGNIIGEFYNEYRIVIPYKDIPERVVEAFVAVEDANFFNHPGLDLVGIFRAFVRNVEAGQIVQGGSTITQQVARAFLLSSERSFRRKIRELMLARRLERNLTKEEILYFYLNQIYLGQGAYGVEGAALTYFSKPVGELSLAEAAFLAGTAQAPSYFSPIDNPKKARARRDHVLRRMVEAGFVRQEEAVFAASGPVTVNLRKPVETPEAAAYIEHVRRLMVRLVGAERFYQEGFKVFTAVDLNLQKNAREAVMRGLSELKRRAAGTAQQSSEIQGALLCMDNPTGQVKAMVGGVDEVQSQFNRAVQARRQPGSVFKPLVWAAAFERGFTPADVVFDEPTEYGDESKTWSPQNYDRSYLGPVTLHEALVQSRNVVAVRLADMVGLPRVIETARKMGIRSDLKPYLSLALGSSEVTLLEMVSAYTAFPNLGQRVRPRFIVRLEDRDGNVLYRASPGNEQALSEASAYMMVDTLKAAVERGTGHVVAGLNRRVGGKTGTTQDLADAWFIGFTPEFTTGVWVGREQREKLGPDESGGRAAAPIFLYFMKEALKKLPPRDFPMPPGVICEAIDASTGEFALEGDETAYKMCFKSDRVGKSENSEIPMGGFFAVQPEPQVEEIISIVEENGQYRLIREPATRPRVRPMLPDPMEPALIPDEESDP